MDDTSRAFLTDIEVQRHKEDPRLDGVRKDHKKLMEIIAAFRGKVDIMVNKQRVDFMQAYEHHIFDIMKEINYLKEKVNEVANDKARNEKMQALQDEQNAFKNEALALDVETNELKKKLRVLTGKTQSLEKERDWLLKKLRSAKTRLQDLREERFQITGMDSQSIPADDSSCMTFELVLDQSQTRDRGNDVTEMEQRSFLKKSFSEKKLTETKSKLFQNFKVTRDPAMINALPHLSEVGPRVTKRTSSQPQLQPISQRIGRGGNAEVDNYMPEVIPEVPDLRYTSSEKKNLAKLVSLRARQEAIRDFVAKCSMGLGRGPWSSIAPRPFEDLLDACSLVVMDPQDRDDERRLLARELAATPETYYALSDLLSGRYSSTALSKNMDYQGSVAQDDLYSNNNSNSNNNNKVDALSDWGQLQSITDVVMRPQSNAGQFMVADEEPINHQGDQEPAQSEAVVDEGGPWLQQDLMGYLQQGQAAFRYANDRKKRLEAKTKAMDLGDEDIEDDEQ